MADEADLMLDKMQQTAQYKLNLSKSGVVASDPKLARQVASCMHRTGLVAREAIKIDPDYPYVYQALAVVHSELGQAEEARAAIENILRIEPKSSISAFDKSQPYQDKELRDRMIEGLRKAGLPD